MDQMQALGIALGLGVLGILILVIFIKSNMVLSQPNELVVIAGRQRRQKDGTVIGYRTIRGGRGFKWPLTESIARLPLTTHSLQFEIGNAMCQGMIPVSIEGRANVKLAGRPQEGMEAAIERFLNKGPDAVTKAAQQTLEGALRGVIATVSPEEANARRLELARQAAAAASEDLRRLGIVLDFFVITDVSDSHGYLEAIGRRRNAEVKRDARIAEATAEAEALKVSSDQRRQGREAEIAADTRIATIEHELAVHRARLAATTNQAEQRAKVAGEIARAEEEIELESRRVKLAEKREEAKTVIPAQAECRARELKARGNSSHILEDGRATAKAVELMLEQWQDGQARDLFLIQLLPTLLDKVTSVVSENLRIDKLTILDGGNGDGVPNYVRNLTNSAVVLLEQLRNATGVDLEKLAEKAQQPSRSIPKELA
jgi:flotillin